MKITQSTYMNDVSTTLTIEFDNTPDAKTIFDVLHAVGGAEVKVVEEGKDDFVWKEGCDFKGVNLPVGSSISIQPNLDTWEESVKEGDGIPVYCKVNGVSGETSIGLSLDNLKELGTMLLSLHKHLTTLKESE